ncbi:DUF4352 domain-containing protein [Selenomonas sputigena]|uniref:Telomeric repeat-binding factor 2 n=1 Tax=Selenomonas sputigena (strain ATCC 35185 / DSM 20758 / CCUG 44933 / VPI D19B-28) TaxID=546271 RepID=C9LST4_SELS3|nr:DUF4352 domain-containing protein [Selenomonas sputigena]AEC00611.1 Telomeric repeat-binding factor 2 [Selenomonas sputigena ATCC 35185]EEX78033.1 hypothetical protein SELSPUOL_00511 [Selenomonas sputigena ATCC 35185]
MKALAGRFAAITLAAVVLCVGGYWFFFAGGSARLLAGSSQQAASTSSQEKAQEGKAANGGEAAAVDAKDVKEAQEKAKEEADKDKEKKEGKSPYSLQVMILEAKRVESIEGAKEDGPFLIVKASIANADKQPVSVVPQGISLTDSDQERHSVSKDGMAALAARQTPVFNAVDIPPGAAATASLVFELDADEHPSVLTIQPAGGGDVMKFHLPESVKGI